MLRASRWHEGSGLPNELNTLYSDGLQAGIPPTKANVFSTYLSRVKACSSCCTAHGDPKSSTGEANVHVVLAFSPVGDAFRTRHRLSPATAMLKGCADL